MARYKVLVIVPFPLSEKGMANPRVPGHGCGRHASPANHLALTWVGLLT